jgi:hypothetical protein
LQDTSCVSAAMYIEIDNASDPDEEIGELLGHLP